MWNVMQYLTLGRYKCNELVAIQSVIVYLFCFEIRCLVLKKMDFSEYMGSFITHMHYQYTKTTYMYNASVR